MSLTLEIAPKDQRELEAAARLAGRSIADYIVQLVREAKSQQRTAIADKLAAFDEWEREISARPDHRAQAKLGPLPDDAVDDVRHAREDAQL